MAVKVRIGGDASGAVAATSEARRAMRALGPEGEKAGQSITASMIKANIIMGVATAGARAFGDALKEVVAGSISTGAEMEALESQLATLLGSAAAAEERMRSLFEIGSTTPFELSELVRADRQLEAFGVNANKWRTAVMDLSSAMGMDLVEAAGAVGRALAGGAGAADILRERGVLAMVTLRTGMTAAELSAEEFKEELFATLTDPDGRIAGGTARLATTFKGLVSNLQDEWTKFQKEIADAGAFDTTKLLLGEILDLIDDNRGATITWAEVIGRGIGEGLLLAFDTLGDIGQGTAAVIEAFIEIGGILAGLPEVAKLAFGPILGPLIPATETIERWQGIVQETGDGFASVDDRVARIRDKLAELDKLSGSTERTTRKITKNLEEGEDAVDGIGDSPLFSAKEWAAVVKQIEKMAGVFDEEAEFARETAALRDQITAAVDAELISKGEAFRLESLLIIAGMDRLSVEQQITDEVERQGTLRGGIGAVSAGLTGGAGTFVSAIPVFGQLIDALLTASERNEDGVFALVQANEDYAATVAAFKVNIGDFIRDTSAQVPKHLTDALKQHPEFVQGIVDALVEVGPEIGPALIDAVIEGLQDPQSAAEMTRMLIELFVLAFHGIPGGMKTAIEDLINEGAQAFVEGFVDLFEDGFREGGRRIAEALQEWLHDAIQTIIFGDGDPDRAGPEDDPNRRGRDATGAGSTTKGLGSSGPVSHETGPLQVSVTLGMDAEQAGFFVTEASNDAQRRGMVTTYSRPSAQVTRDADSTGGVG